MEILFSPEIPVGMQIRKITMDGQTFWSQEQDPAERPLDTLRFQLSGQREIQFEHQAGIGVIPFISRPFPEDPSQGYRIIDQKLSGQEYLLQLEGKSNSFADFELNIFDQKVNLIENAELLTSDKNGWLKIRVYFPEFREKYCGVTVRIVLLPE